MLAFLWGVSLFVARLAGSTAGGGYPFLGHVNFHDIAGGVLCCGGLVAVVAPRYRRWQRARAEKARSWHALEEDEIRRVELVAMLEEDEKARSWRALEEGEIATRAGEMTIAE